MAAMTASRILDFVGQQDEVSPRVAPNATYFKGGLLVFNAAGYAAAPSDAAALFPAGIVTTEWEDGDRVDEKVVAAGESPRARLKRGKVWLPVSGATQDNVGKLFYIADDQTLTQTAGSKTVGLVALDFKPGHLFFDLRTFDRIA